MGSLQEAEIKVLQDKLKQSEQKSAEFRNQCQSLRQELKVTQKVDKQTHQVICKVDMTVGQAKVSCITFQI